MLPLLIGIVMANSDWGPHINATEEWTESFISDQDGQCNTQRLYQGVKLPEREDIYIMRRPDRTYGTQNMIDVLTSVAEEVAWLIPEADPLVIGDISKKKGGPLPGHLSHRGGLDVDIGLFFDNGQQPTMGFMDISPSRLDKETMWVLIRALLDTGEVERILLDKSLIKVMRQYVIDSGELTRDESIKIFPYITGKRAFLYDNVVHHHAGHKHHIHVRIRCN